MALPQAQRDVEGSEQGDEHSKSSAVHQDKMWGGTPWYEFSEENLTMARCGALRGVARLGQVVASWESLIIFKVPIVREGHANRVQWVALWYEFGWLLLHVIRALFRSRQCCTFVGPISGAPMLCPRAKVSRTVLS